MDIEHGKFVIMLTGRQKRFAFEYVKDFVGTKAAIRAGYSEEGASVTASRLLADANVQAEIEDQKETLARVATLSPAWLIRKVMDIVSANPSDLVSVKQLPCPACWEALGDANGLPPNPECATCRGEGVKHVSVADTRYLKGPAKQLYAGAKQTKDGIEIKMHNQIEAMKMLASFMGMQIERKEVSGPGGGPVQLQPVGKPLSEMTDEELNAIAQKAPEPAKLGVGLGVLPQVIDATLVE